MMRDIQWGRVAALFFVPNAVFAVLAFIPPAVLISIFNSAILALAVGVCVAFWPAVWEAVTKPGHLDRADFLAIGIFCGWFGLIEQRIWSVVWRAMGRPDALENTHLTSYGLYLFLWAAIYHLAAPGAIQGRVPPVRWVKIGVWIAAAMFVGFLVSYAAELLDLAPRRA